MVPHRLSVLCSLRTRASAAPREFPANKPINNAEMCIVPRVCQARVYVNRSRRGEIWIYGWRDEWRESSESGGKIRGVRVRGKWLDSFAREWHAMEKLFPVSLAISR